MLEMSKGKEFCEMIYHIQAECNVFDSTVYLIQIFEPYEQNHDIML